MKSLKTLFVAASLSMAVASAFAQTATPVAPATPTAPATAAAPQPWTHKVKQLSRAEIDAYLSTPKNVVVIDVRRPDELTTKGGFPAYLSIQISDIEKYIDYIPKDRTIITVSNRAHRAGDAGDLLLSKGYKVAGAAGTQDYEEQGGSRVVRIAPPPPRNPTAQAAATPATPVVSK